MRSGLACEFRLHRLGSPDLKFSHFALRLIILVTVLIILFDGYRVVRLLNLKTGASSELVRAQLGSPDSEFMESQGKGCLTYFTYPITNIVLRVYLVDGCVQSKALDLDL